MGLLVDDIGKLEMLSSRGYKHFGEILYGCVIALDGFGVATWQPYAWEVKWPKNYCFHKGGFAIIVLPGCDIQARFIAASCDHSGSTNDIIAWQDTKLHKLLEVDKLLPSKYFKIGNEMFTNTFQLLSTWSGRGLDPYKDSFQTMCWMSLWYAHTMLGNILEDVHFSFDCWTFVVMSAMKLHKRWHDNVHDGDAWVVYDNYHDDDAEVWGHPAGDHWYE